MKPRATKRTGGQLTDLPGLEPVLIVPNTPATQQRKAAAVLIAVGLANEHVPITLTTDNEGHPTLTGTDTPLTHALELAKQVTDALGLNEPG